MSPSDQVKLIPLALKRLRESTGLRQIDVFRRSGLSKAMLSSYESGKALPSIISLSAYLGAIGRDLSDLQEVLDEIGGVPLPTSEVLDARRREERERAVGRAVLRVLREVEAFPGGAADN
jgi:transcriptional regulator with XRE-family HTH domain